MCDSHWASPLVSCDWYGLPYREEQHLECDRRLESELEGLRARTGLEMEQLRTQTREVYERENRVLAESRDTAVGERDRAKAAEKEITDKYENLLKE